MLALLTLIALSLLPMFVLALLMNRYRLRLVALLISAPLQIAILYALVEILARSADFDLGYAGGLAVFLLLLAAGASAVLGPGIFLIVLFTLTRPAGWRRKVAAVIGTYAAGGLLLFMRLNLA